MANEVKTIPLGGSIQTPDGPSAVDVAKASKDAEAKWHACVDQAKAAVQAAYDALPAETGNLQVDMSIKGCRSTFNFVILHLHTLHEQKNI